MDVLWLHPVKVCPTNVSDMRRFSLILSSLNLQRRRREHGDVNSIVSPLSDLLFIPTTSNGSLSGRSGTGESRSASITELLKKESTLDSDPDLLRNLDPDPLRHLLDLS